MTTKGTRWGAQGDSEQDVRDNFFGLVFGIEIAEVQPVRIWSAEYDEGLKREKAIWRSR